MADMKMCTYKEMEKETSAMKQEEEEEKKCFFPSAYNC